MERWREDHSESSDKEDINDNEDEDGSYAYNTCGFETDQVFNSRQNLIDWVYSVGFSLGYVIVIKRSINRSYGFIVQLKCDRGGIYKSKKISTRNTGSKKIGCPFELEGKCLREGDGWRLNIICGEHNHGPSSKLEGHPYARRLSKNEAQIVEDLSKKFVKPRAILETIKQQNQGNVSTVKTIYNERQKLRETEKGGRTQMQVVMTFLQENGYVFYSRTNDRTNELEDLFFAHPQSLEICRAFPDVLLMDATYKTNRYKMPLLEIVGVTSTNTTFCIAFVFMHEEKESNYTWALNCLKSTIDGCTSPRVIVTDRELALMNACKHVFPKAKGLLCRWHINRNILKKCRPTIKSREYWNLFYRAWSRLIESETEKVYMSNFAQLEAILLNFPGVLTYLNATWLTPYREMFVSAWIDKFLNFGNHTTNRVESQHAKLKRYLESSNSDFERSLAYIHQVIQSQVTSINAGLEQSKILVRHRFNTPVFRELRGFISIYALEIILNEFERSKDNKFYSGNCGCQLRTSHGLPCAHEQVIYFNKGRPIPLDSIDKFWRKLDLLPCTPVGDDDFGCEIELQMFNAQFKKQSRSRKFSFLRKLREIIAPSTTSVREPAFHATSRGRPSLKDKLFRKNRVDPPVRTQKPAQKPTRKPEKSTRKQDQIPAQPTQKPSRHSCSSARFVEVNKSQFPEPARHSYSTGQQYSFHPYIHQFPAILHPYIMQVQDVMNDGNCGFRAIAVCLGLSEDAWPTIRHNLIEELVTYEAEYVEMFGNGGWLNVYNSLNFFEIGRCAPHEHWMSMPEMGVLIASKYNVILHVLSIQGSMTHLPLRSSPPPWYQHVAIAIGHVNNNHYVQVTMTGGYPMPTLMPQWVHFKYNCANGWATPYLDRINNYQQYLRSNYSAEFIVLD